MAEDATNIDDNTGDDYYEHGMRLASQENPLLLHLEVEGGVVKVVISVLEENFFFIDKSGKFMYYISWEILVF